MTGFWRIRYKHPAFLTARHPPIAPAGSEGETMDARPEAPRVDVDEVRRFIAEYSSIDPQDVTDDVRLDDLGLDWLDQLELMVLIEEEFVGVDFFANNIVTQMVLVGDLMRHIEHHNYALARRSAA